MYTMEMPTKLCKQLIRSPRLQIVEDDLELLLPTCSVSPAQFSNLMAYAEGNPSFQLPAWRLHGIICVVLFHNLMEILSCQYKPLPHFSYCVGTGATSPRSINYEC